MIPYNKAPVRYTTELIDLGGGADILQKLIGPKGKKGWIYDVGVMNVVEAFNGGTTHPGVRVGTIADDDAYLDDFSFGALAVNSGGKSLRTTYRPTEIEDLAAMVNPILPADTAFMVTWIAATGAGLTGQATGFIDVVWED